MRPLVLSTLMAVLWLLVAVAQAGASERLALVREAVGGVALWRPPALLTGQLGVLELETGEDCQGPRVVWNGASLPAHPVAGRWHVLVPVSLRAKPREVPLVVSCGVARVHFSLPIRRGKYPVSRLSVASRYTRKPPGRVAQESAYIAASLADAKTPRMWARSFLRPAPGVQTSIFGTRRIFNRRARSRHEGLDIDGRRGDPLVAANDGIVVLAARDFHYVGNAVFLHHGDGLYSLYFHMQDVVVQTGELVRRGQSIGTIGDSGRVTGAHLHFAVRYRGIYVNPKDLLAYSPKAWLGPSSPPVVASAR